MYVSEDLSIWQTFLSLLLFQLFSHIKWAIGQLGSQVGDSTEELDPNYLEMWSQHGGKLTENCKNGRLCHRKTMSNTTRRNLTNLIRRTNQILNIRVDDVLFFWLTINRNWIWRGLRESPTCWVSHPNTQQGTYQRSAVSSQIIRLNCRAWHHVCVTHISSKWNIHPASILFN